MIPGCKGCEFEYELGLEELKLDHNVAWEGLGVREHLFIAVFDKEGNCILL